MGNEGSLRSCRGQVQALKWSRDRGKGLRIEALMPVARGPEPRRVLAGYLERMGAEPPAEAAFERRRAHYVNIGFQEAQDYYWRCLLADAVARCAASLRGQGSDWRPTHLATVVSGTPSIVAMAPLAAGVKRCLLLHEQDEAGEIPAPIRQCLEKVARGLRAADIGCVPGPVRVGERGRELEQIRAHLGAFAGGIDPGQLAFKYGVFRQAVEAEERLGEG